MAAYILHNSLISRDIKTKSAFRQILAAEGAEQCDKIYYHIAKLSRYNELCNEPLFNLYNLYLLTVEIKVFPGFMPKNYFPNW